MSAGYHLFDTGVTGKRFLNGGFHVPDQHQWCVHIHLQKGGGTFVTAEALAQQDVFQFAADAAAGVAYGVNTFVCQGFCDHLTEQQLGIITVCGNIGQEKNPPGSAQTDAVRKSCIPDSAVKLRCAEIAPGQCADTGRITPHQQHAVTGLFRVSHQGADLPGKTGCRAVRRRDPVKRDLRDGQQRFILTIPQVKPVLVDEVLNGRIDVMGNVTVLVHIFPDAAGTDVFQFGRKTQLDQVAGHQSGRLFRQGRLVRSQEDDVIH